MSCSAIQDRMIDVLYGEELDSRRCFEFFSHLRECRRCRGEYGELLETRRMLADWQVEDAPSDLQLPASGAAGRGGAPGRAGWWPWAQRVAAVVLMAVGALALLQQVVPMGLTSDPVSMSQQELDQRVYERASELIDEEMRDLLGRVQTNLENMKGRLEAVKQDSAQRDTELLKVLQSAQERRGI